ncbi:hypothetical protein NBM05_04765 [Rothia sp. AR01]|uniref:ABC transporter domain-containing protein n=1 Tax=Rothia santali TaxID=2949643 RepID=A0A9X2KHM8_9MICC|nr:ATP-binding cassette domain-containing protein [Rothia santali]MCP3425348.1 hypothetical protein [Rothia santali]
MLVAENLRAAGRRTPLVPATSLSAAPGELLLVRAEDPLTRAGLALLLTGRMRPTEGRVRWDGDPSRRALRRRSGVVDSPVVNAMERHQRVRDHAAEMLSYLRPSPLRRSSTVAWLEDRGLGDLTDLREEELTGGQRLRLACALAGADADAELLVFDTPSRHAADPAREPDAWLAPLLELARDEDHPRAVVAVVPVLPDGWDGPVAEAGRAETDGQEADGAAGGTGDRAASPEADDGEASPEALRESEEPAGHDRPADPAGPADAADATAPADPQDPAHRADRGDPADRISPATPTRTIPHDPTRRAL